MVRRYDPPTPIDYYRKELLCKVSFEANLGRATNTDEQGHSRAQSMGLNPNLQIVSAEPQFALAAHELLSRSAGKGLVLWDNLPVRFSEILDSEGYNIEDIGEENDERLSVYTDTNVNSPRLERYLKRAVLRSALSRNFEFLVERKQGARLADGFVRIAIVSGGESLPSDRSGITDENLPDQRAYFYCALMSFLKPEVFPSIPESEYFQSHKRVDGESRTVTIRDRTLEPELSIWAQRGSSSTKLAQFYTLGLCAEFVKTLQELGFEVELKSDETAHGSMTRLFDIRREVSGLPQLGPMFECR